MYPAGRNSKRVTISVLVALFAVVCAAESALAQSTLPPRRPPPLAPAPVRPAPAAPSEAIPAPAGPVTAEVTGFRSARFGMTEAQVRAAIEKDFRMRPDEIRSEENKAEQTQVLVVQAPDVLPGGGTASVSYVFGFKSKTLIQVGLSWSKATDEKMTPEQLFSDANILRSHFLESGYKPDTVATNMPVNGGILMFRGSDPHEHTTVLVLQGTFSQGENNQRVLTPTALLLFYIVDAKSPDVYRLPPGSF
ncbi:MAG: hypothetical protein WB760_21115 [Xanthobacteraceae bacterium]